MLLAVFEAAEIGQTLDKDAYKREIPKLREAMLKAQTDLASSELAVVILMGGVEGAGKSETVNLLLEWLDARGVQVHALTDPSDEESERPPFWRFWRAIPPEGRMAFFVGSWYTAPIVSRAFDRLDAEEFDAELDRIAAFEKMLAGESTLVLKFWLHLSKDRQRKRLAELEDDPKTSWRVTKADWKFAKRYDTFRRICESALHRTSTAECPWHIVESTDHRHRNVTVARAMIDAICKSTQHAKEPRAKFAPDVPKPQKLNLINRLDLSKKLDEATYDDRLPKLQGRLARLSRRLHDAQRSMIVLFEGPDAAGKGGAIRRITHAIDARNYQVISVAAPTEEERSHPYLWRFWRHLPRLGRVTIYDRSWYGRVLVERLEGFCAPADWQRAFSEITDFEAQLAEFGIVVVKFWLAISSAEQLRRFKDRQETPYKQYKIGPDDWRNRAKWNAYEAGACEMIERTSTSDAPWTLVEANDKRWARVKVLKTIVERLDGEL